DGETLAIVGESGCGKSTTGKLIVRLLEPSSGRIIFRGEDITHRSRRELRDVRRHLQIVFQDPYASLNPRARVEDILAEPLHIHGEWDRISGPRHILELLERVGLSADHRNRLPHEFSGGQRQRIAIARALALSPRLLVLDEPVSALDLSVQAQIINLLLDLRAELGLSLIFISHDLSVGRHVADRIAVMYLGKIVEIGTAAELLRSPCHPYTQALLSAAPASEPAERGFKRRIRFAGHVPSAMDAPSGCV